MERLTVYIEGEYCTITQDIERCINKLAIYENLFEDWGLDKFDFSEFQDPYWKEEIEKIKTFKEVLNMFSTKNLSSIKNKKYVYNK